MARPTPRLRDDTACRPPRRRRWGGVVHSGAVPTADLSVRLAEPSELDEAGRLCVAAYTASGHLSASDPYAETLRDARSRATSTEVLVALRGNVVVGTVTICPADSPYAEISNPDESEFRFLAVSPEAWRTGVGEALVEACELRAGERGRVAQVICVIDSNAPAHHFYTRLGFSRLPDRDWSPVQGVQLLAYRRAVPWVGSAQVR